MSSSDVKENATAFSVDDLSLGAGDFNKREDYRDRETFKKPSIISRFLYTHFTPFVMKASRTGVDKNDLPPLDPRICSEKISLLYSDGWEGVKTSKGDFTLGGMIISLGKKAFLISFLFESFAEICHQMIPFLLQLILGLLDEYNGQKESTYTQSELFRLGMAISLAFFVFQCLHALFLNRATWITYKNALLVKIGLTGLIFDKSLSMSSTAKQSFPFGKSVNLISTNISRVETAYPYFRYIWFSPIQILFLIYMVYRCVGTAAFYILALVLLAMPVQIFLTYRMNLLRKSIAKLTERRLRFLQETIMGIKVVKFFAWENIFTEKLRVYRAEELSQIRSLLTWASGSMLLNVFVQSFACVLGYFMYTRDGRKPSADDFFSALTYFNMLDFPLQNVPLTTSNTVEAYNALLRLQTFLRAADRKKVAPPNPNAPDAIRILDGEFRWNISEEGSGVPMDKKINTSPLDEEIAMAEIDEMSSNRIINVSPETQYDVAEHTWYQDKDQFSGLCKLNICIPRGSLVAIVGPVGCGKSSLLQSIFGDMEQISGSMVIGGSIGYCPQQAWILNTSIRQNIIVNQPFEEERYWQVIRDCQIEDDLLAMPLGDRTAIGEGGISLSGGQKARLNLARMVYFNKDIALMDDPLSAVDNKVGKALFKECIVTGSLSNKTRILATHHLGVLSECDYVIVMKHGQVIEQGTYEELIKHSTAFADLLQKYNQGQRTHPENEEQHEVIDDQLSEEMFEVPRSATPIDKMTTSKEEANAQQKAWRDEELQAHSVSGRVYLEYIMAAGGYSFLVLGLVAVIVNEGVRTLRDVWLNWWVDYNDAFGLNLTQEGFRYFYAFLTPAQVFTCSICAFIFIYFGNRASRNLHDKALGHVIRSPIRFFDSTPAGRIINRFGRDMDVVDTLAADDIWCLMYSIVSVSAVLSVMFVFAKWAAPVFFIPLGIIFLLQTYYRTSAQYLQRMYASFFSPVMANYSETYVGLPVVHAMGLENHFRSRQMKSLNLLSRAVLATNALRRWSATRSEFISAIMLSVSTAFLFYMKFSSEAAGLILASLICFNSSLDWIIKQMANVDQDMVSVERLHQYATELEMENTDIYSITPPPAWPSEGRVEFRNLFMSYRSNTRPVLCDLCLQVNPCERIGIVGRTGAGKSSIMAALMRSVEWSDGAILIDGINIKDISLKDLRSRVTIVPQDPIMFAGPLRFNLDPTETRSDDDLWSSLDKVGLRSTVLDLEGKLDYDVHDFGEDFSLGQRQLFCLARALLRKSKIVLMDEATASMDVETDAMIQHAIRKDFNECTIITIAHRLGTIRDYDRIVVMDYGRIVEVGNPDVLLAEPESHLSQLFLSSLKAQKLAP